MMTESSRPTLLHSCARAATAAECRYRIDSPNSRPRASRIVALDGRAAEIMASVAHELWYGAHFLTLAPEQPDGGSSDLMLNRRDGSSGALTEEIADADVVVMLCTTSEGRGAAEIIGETAKRRSIMTAGLVLGDETGTVNDEVVHALRPFCSVLVVAEDPEYVPAMLTALRA